MGMVALCGWVGVGVFCMFVGGCACTDGKVSCRRIKCRERWGESLRGSQKLPRVPRSARLNMECYILSVWALLYTDGMVRMYKMVRMYVYFVCHRLKLKEENKQIYKKITVLGEKKHQKVKRANGATYLIRNTLLIGTHTGVHTRTPSDRHLVVQAVLSIHNSPCPTAFIYFAPTINYV